MNERVRVLARAGGGSRTQQEFKNECDINRIVKRYVKTGVPPVGRPGGLYGDFSNVGDFREAQERVARAWDGFMRLPAAVRERFANDPGRLLAFVRDPANADEAIKLGIMSDEFKAKREAELAAAAAAKAAAAK